MTFDEILLAVEASARTKARFDFDASLSPFTYPYAIYQVGTFRKMFAGYWLKDFMIYDAVELAVVGFQNELAVASKVVLGEQSSICVNAKDVEGVDVDEVRVVVVIHLGGRLPRAPQLRSPQGLPTCTP